MLSLIWEMFKCNKLLLHPSKSEFVVVTIKRLIAWPILFIGSDLIKEVSSFKYLGVYDDVRLKYNVQVQYIKIKLSELCEVLFSLSKLLRYTLSDCIYISYSIGVWSDILQCTSRRNGLKLIHKKKYLTICIWMFLKFFITFRQVRISKLKHIHKLNVASYMFNILKREKISHVMILSLYIVH